MIHIASGCCVPGIYWDRCPVDLICRSGSVSVKYVSCVGVCVCVSVSVCVCVCACACVGVECTCVSV